MQKPSLILICTLIAACNRTPPAQLSQTPAASAAADQSEVAGSSLPSDGSQLDANTFPSPSVAPAVSIPQFANSSATEGAQAYAAALAELKNQPTPPSTIGQSALSNPSLITGSLNQLAAKLNALSQAKQQVEANLAPGEVARWEVFQKSQQ